MTLRILDHSFEEPAMNLALDEALLDAAEEGLSGETLRFWESPVPFVVLGTAQEVAKEADEAACAADGVPVLRRCTAGGCVLQGPGSLNYALVLLPELRPEVRTLKGSYCYILHALSDAFGRLGLDVRHEGTCDLAMAGRKVSGNAQKRRRRAFLHHGTLLYRADPVAMGRYLREPEDRPEYGQGCRGTVCAAGGSGSGSGMVTRKSTDGDTEFHGSGCGSERISCFWTHLWRCGFGGADRKVSRRGRESASPWGVALWWAGRVFLPLGLGGGGLRGRVGHGTWADATVTLGRARWGGYETILTKTYTPRRSNPLVRGGGDVFGYIPVLGSTALCTVVNFFSGFRGCGKTTELRRLQKLLKEAGFSVTYANALDYLSPAEPVEISDFLVALAGAFSDATEKSLGIDLGEEGFWSRFVAYLSRTKVKVDGFDMRFGASASPVGANLKAALRENPTFRQKLRESMAPRMAELRSEVHRFFEDGRKRIQDARGNDKNGVFIFDQLEQLRDTLTTGSMVSESVASLVANHRSALKIPHFHTVYTVPPWLTLKLSDLANVRMLYSVKLWKNSEKREHDPHGWEIMRNAVARRFSPEGIERFFGKPSAKGKGKHPADHHLVNKLILSSGGHFRDLILLLRETVLRAKSLPIDDAIVEAAITNLRQQFLPIPHADAAWLQKIGKMRDCLLKDRSPESVQRMTFFLDTHCALILRNGEEWYDIHPVIRDEVDEIVQRTPAPDCG
jgi:lipoate-protein ligase A